MTDVDQTFEDLRGNEMFPPGTSREEQICWWEARLELLERELRQAQFELLKLS